MLTRFKMGVHFSVVVVLILLLQHSRSHGSSGTSTNKKEGKVLNIGVILDSGSFVSKDAQIAMEIAREDFNAKSRGYKLKLHYNNSGGKPLQALSSAKYLIRRKKVMAIIGPETWKAAELVAELGNQFQVPVISLSRNPSGSTTPGLIEMGNGWSEEIRSIANIVQSYNRQRVVTIYEEDTYDDNYSLSSYLSEGLQAVGSEIEDRVVLPPSSSLHDPESVVKEKLRRFQGKISPVFIILDLSLPSAGRLLEEAKHMGFFEGDSIWILSVKVFNLLDSANSSVTSFMKGAIGLVTDLPIKNKRYSDFSRKFRSKLKREVTRDFKPGIHVLRAYDSVAVVTNAVIGASTTEITPQFLMKRIVESRFDGLSGKIAFKEGRMVNLAKVGAVSVGGGKTLHKELKIRSCDAAIEGIGGITHSHTAAGTSSVPDVSQSGPMIKIVVPHQTPFDKFVKQEVDDSDKTTYVGFCIDVFHEILSILNHNNNFRYAIYSTESTYDDLVLAVQNKTYDAAIGDITILANRSEKVDFTQPYIESGLSMIVVAEAEGGKEWIFLKPFTPKMWMATGAVLICTMLTVWFLERLVNPEFQGPWTDQLATALWFTFSSLFFAHRERIYQNLTRVVLVVWFFMALILTQSYTASLTSMLTVQGLKPNEITMESLKQSNSKVGCDNTTFVCHYLERVHNFSKDNIEGNNNYTDFHEQLKKGRIKAVFLEYPYERAFLSLYCKGFSVTHQSYRFGGFGFAFQNGSSWTAKFSEAILKLSESAKLKSIGDVWFRPDCVMENATTSSDSETQRLGLNSFWALYVFSLGTSMLCLLLSCICLKGNGDNVHTNNADKQQHDHPTAQGLELGDR